MRLVPVLFPCDLGFTDRGRHAVAGERSAPDYLLGILEGEGVRLARPEVVSVPIPEAEAAPEAPLKLDGPVAQAISDLSGLVAQVNANGDFPLVLGGDQTAMCGHVLGHARRHPAGIGLAVLADAYLDLSLPAPVVYDDKKRLATDAEVTATGNAEDMVLSAALRQLPDSCALGTVMKDSSVQAAQTSVLGVRVPLSAQVKAVAKRTKIEVWDMERLELDGESAYRSMLTRHLAAGPIVLSVDVRGLDPHLMTAVRNPVSDGIDWSFLKRSFEQCMPHIDRILGLDLCQVEPTRDDVSHSATNRFVETIVPFLRKLSR